MASLGRISSLLGIVDSLVMFDVNQTGLGGVGSWQLGLLLCWKGGGGVTDFGEWVCVHQDGGKLMMT